MRRLQVKQTGSDEERGPVFLNESEELELNGAPSACSWVLGDSRCPFPFPLRNVIKFWFRRVPAALSAVSAVPLPCQPSHQPEPRLR